MIESIKLKEAESLDGTIKEFTFGKRNVIIGPKGGGKSTLFDLLANASQQNILSTTIEALGKHKLEFYSITIDGEEIHSSSLSLKTLKKGKISKEKAELYDKRNDVIYQDDSIKKNLSDSLEFDKQKLKFAKEVIETSNEVNEFILKLRKVHEAVSKVAILDDVRINFFNSFGLKEDLGKADEQLIFDLNYSASEVKLITNQDILQLKNEKENYKDQVNHLKMKINIYDSDKSTFISEKYMKDLIKKYEEIINSYEDLIKHNVAEQNKIRKIHKITTSFEKAYKNKITSIKKDSEETETKTKRLQVYKSESENHFITMAKRIKMANKTFEDFIIKKVGIELDVEQDAGNMLKLELKGNIVFTEEQKYNYMKKILFNAKKIQTHVANWIMSTRIKGIKEFKIDSVVSEMARNLKPIISVTADGQDYETMSLGQKSIYGIKHKFSYSIGQPMFLDQPEDNLDNYTIATEILDLINSKNEQMFIITHNANIGILARPNRVIVGAFEKNDEDKQTIDQYQEGTIEEPKETEIHSDTAHYLEGGIEYIKNRLKIIEGGN